MAASGRILVGLIALLHLYIAWFEMFAWTTRGPRVFASMPVELFEPTTVMAANQGVYNAFLAVGLLWGLLIRDRQWGSRIMTCFLCFVVVAGVFGGLSAAPRILLVQALPAVIALVLLWWPGPRVSQVN